MNVYFEMERMYRGRFNWESRLSKRVINLFISFYSFIHFCCALIYSIITRWYHIQYLYIFSIKFYTQIHIHTNKYKWNISLYAVVTKWYEKLSFCEGVEFLWLHDKFITIVTQHMMKLYYIKNQLCAIMNKNLTLFNIIYLEKELTSVLKYGKCDWW